MNPSLQLFRPSTSPLRGGVKKDVLAKDTSKVCKFIYVAIPDQPLTKSALG